MRQFLWLYIRAWVWARLSAWPRIAWAFWAWLGLGVLCALSLVFDAEIWPHTPAAATYAALGLVLAGIASGWLLLRSLWQWLDALGRQYAGWRRALWVALLVLGGGVALAGLAGVVALGMLWGALITIDGSGATN